MNKTGSKELVPGLNDRVKKYQLSLERSRTHKHNRPAFLQPCVVKATATKSHSLKEVGTSYSYKIYERTEWIRSELEEPQTMVYVGFRTVKNGSLKYRRYGEYGEESEPYFAPTEVFEVWLFVKNERENIIRAFPEDVEKTINTGD